MKWLLGLLMLTALAFLTPGCGDDDDGPVAATDNPPDAVTDLAVIAVDDSSITLTWNTPDDKRKSASVSGYDLRYSTSTITEGNFASADTVHGEPLPGEAEMADTFLVEGLDLATLYYFALKSADDKDHWSDISNVLHASTDTVDNRLIAYYPLVDDSIDVTGNQSPIHLTNTPFEEGGIYSNGKYIFDIEPGGCLAQTPNIVGLDFDSFTISVRFKVSEYFELGWNPVFIGGHSGRWLGLRLQTDSTASLLYRDTGNVSSTEIYVAGTWHEATVTYDGTTARLYLDGVAAAEKEFDLTPFNDEDHDVSNTHFGHGGVFKGHLGRLKIYSGVVTP